MTKKLAQTTAPQAADQQNLSASRSTGGETADDAAIPTRGSHAESRVDNAQAVAKDSRPELGTSSRRGFIMNTIVSAAAVASATAIPSHSAQSLQQVSSREGDLRALHAYASWLHMERRILCRELWPELGSAADKFVHANNAGFNWHIDGRGSLNWNEGPQPSSRAETVLDLVGVDWRADVVPEARQSDAGKAIDPIFAAIEAHRQTGHAFEVALDRLQELEESPRRGELDDERRAADEAAEETGRANDRCALAMLDVEPTTIAGVIALLDYIAECESTRHVPFPEWVGDVQFQGVLSARLAKAIRAINYV